MSEDRIGHLEYRVTAIENQIVEIRSGFATMHDDLLEGNQLTRQIQKDTEQVVKAGTTIAMMSRVITWFFGLGAGAYGIVKLFAEFGPK